MAERWRDSPNGETCPKCGQALGYRDGVHIVMGRNDPIVVKDEVLRCRDGHFVS